MFFFLFPPREDMEKVNIKFHDNGTVTYQHKKILQFVPEMSVDKDQKLTVPNIPLLVRFKEFLFNPTDFSNCILHIFSDSLHSGQLPRLLHPEDGEFHAARRRLQTIRDNNRGRARLRLRRQPRQPRPSILSPEQETHVEDGSVLRRKSVTA